MIEISGVVAIVPTPVDDPRWHRPELHVEYPGFHLDQLPLPMRPFVLLEPGNARVVPFVECDMTSFVHESLETVEGLADFDENRPRSLRCLHPLVTLLGKLDALAHRFTGEYEPSSFVRHYEDAARIVTADALPPIDGFVGVRPLAVEMLTEGDIRQPAQASDAAFNPDGSERWRAIAVAYAAIAPMFWGPRIQLDDACALIRDWLHANLP